MRVFLGMVACAQLGTLWAQGYVISTVAGGAPAPAAATATSVAVGLPGRAAVDPSGNVYFTALNSVFRLSSGVMTRVAGNGQPGYSGDGGPALSAQLNSPQGLAIDSAGDIYIADTLNQVVRYVSASTGVITTIAGNGTPGANGDYGIPTQAQLDLPTAVVLDAQNNVYICDSANNVIRELTNGVIVPYLGSYNPGFAGDGSGSISLNTPTDIFFDSAGNFWIADFGNLRIREFANTGVTSTVIGGGTTYTEGGFGTATALGGPHSVVVDNNNNVYVADTADNRVRILNLVTSKITTFAGAGNPGFAGDGAAANLAQLNTPNALAIDHSGNVYIVDLFNYRVRVVNSSGVISTAVGNGVFEFAGDGGPAQAAQMRGLANVAVSSNTVFLSDTSNQRVRQINSSGVISTIAGNGTPGFGGDNGASTSAQVAFPGAVATDASGNLYFADTGNQRVRKISNGTISTVAGNGSSGYSGDGSAATNATLNGPSGLAFDRAGNLYISDRGNNVVRKVSSAGIITTVAGSGLQAYAGDGGLATAAGLNGPQGLAVDASGNLYIADSENHVVRIVSPGGVIKTFAGTGALGDTGDGGPAVNAVLATPYGVAVDASGNVYISDSGASRVRVVAPGGVITTIAGTGTAGYSGDNGPANNARLNSVGGIAVDSQGDLYIADQGNNVLREVQYVYPTPSVGAVVNAASNLPGPVAPGEWVTIYGSGLGPMTLTSSQTTASGLTPTSVAGTTAKFNSNAAPIFYTWATQLGAVVPYEATTGTANLTVQFGTQASPQVPVTVAASAPGLFTLNGSGTGQALAVNQGTGALNASTSPVPQGAVITLYATGAGQLTPSAPDGTPDSAGSAHPVLPVTATIGGIAANVTYAGGDTGLPPGMIRVDVTVPTNITGPLVPVVLTIGTASSQAGVTIAVQ